MSNDSHHELIIIKRHEEEEHEAHSSAWKVAHADFMTAMMAFFLIMWLINVTDSDTRKAIAHYFNPVNLADNLSPRRGLDDPENQKDQGTSDNGDKFSSLKNTIGSKTGPGDDLQQGAKERALFQDPYATLAQLAAEAEPQAPTTADVPVGEVGVAGTGAGEAQRDPFDPAYWQIASANKPLVERAGSKQNSINAPGAAPLDAAAPRPDPAAGGPQTLGGADQKTPLMPGKSGKGTDSANGGAAQVPSNAQARAGAAKDGQQAQSQSAQAAQSQPKPGAQGQTQVANGQAQAGPAQGQAQGMAQTQAQQAQAQAEQQARAVQAQIADAVRANMGPLGSPRVEVRATKEGLLIDLTDDTNFSMFSVGSAVPDGRLVRVMERVGQIIASRPGEVVVRGYTDGRPFRTDTYDNWRLSMARAHISYYMLARGGVDEKRFARIEGFADRNLKNAADPNAPENRRIEILLKEPGK